MADTTVAENGISILKLEEVVIGSQLKIAAFFEKLVSEDPDIFEPIDFTNMVLKADIKDRPSKDVLADAVFVCEKRDAPGWIDLTLDGTATGSLSQKTYYSSIKVWPVDHPEQGDTLLIITLPMKYLATR